MTKIKIDNMIVKAKIDILEPISNGSGTIYYTGFVNGVHTHFIGYDRLTKKELKEKLLRKHIKDGYLVEKVTELSDMGVYYGR